LKIDSEKLETNQYLLKEKNKDESIFDKRKVKNNTIDYQLQSIVPTLGLEINSRKVIDYREKLIFDKEKSITIDLGLSITNPLFQPWQ